MDPSFLLIPSASSDSVPGQPSLVMHRALHIVCKTWFFLGVYDAVPCTVPKLSLKTEECSLRISWRLIDVRATCNLDPAAVERELTYSGGLRTGSPV